MRFINGGNNCKDSLTTGKAMRDRRRLSGVVKGCTCKCGIMTKEMGCQSRVGLTGNKTTNNCINSVRAKAVAGKRTCRTGAVGKLQYTNNFTKRVVGNKTTGLKKISVLNLGLRLKRVLRILGIFIPIVGGSSMRNCRDKLVIRSRNMSSGSAYNCTKNCMKGLVNKRV